MQALRRGGNQNVGLAVAIHIHHWQLAGVTKRVGVASHRVKPSGAAGIDLHSHATTAVEYHAPGAWKWFAVVRRTLNGPRNYQVFQAIAVHVEPLNSYALVRSVRAHMRRPGALVGWRTITRVAQANLSTVFLSDGKCIGTCGLQ